MKMTKRIAALVLAAALSLNVGVMPVLAVESEPTIGQSQPADSGDQGELQEQCSCKSPCAGALINFDCPVCGVEGADLSLCEGTEPGPVCAELAGCADGAHAPECPLYEEPAAEKCVCTAPCTGEAVNADCPVCGAEGVDLTACRGQAPAAQLTAVEQVQVLIDALPSVEQVQSMNEEDKTAAYAQGQTAYEAYEALSDEEKALITGAKVFEELFAWFNGQIMVLEGEVCKNTTQNSIHASLSDAISAAQSGDVIVMMADDDATQPITIDKDLTIDLAGYNLLNTTFKITSGTVVIGDRKGTGEINSQNAPGFEATENTRCSSTIYITNNAQVSLNNLRVFQCAEDDLEKAIFLGGNASLTINGGSYSGPKESGVDAVFYYNDSSTASLTINDGYFEANCALSVNKTPGSGGGSLTIKKATFVGNGTAFWIVSGGSVDTIEEVQQFLTEGGSQVIGEFNQARIVVGSRLFPSEGFTGPENGSIDPDNPAHLTPNADDTITLEPQVLGGNGGALSYEWEKDGTPIEGETGTVYTINSYDPEIHDGLYSVTVTEDGTENRLTLYWQVGEVADVHTHSHDMSTECGSDDPIVFTEWDGTGAFPGGNVCLSQDVTLSADLAIMSDVNLCLNGHTLSAESQNVSISVLGTTAGAPCTLNICDCGNSGSITTYINNKTLGIMNFYGGTIQNATTYGDGIYNWGNLTVYGGKVIGAKGISILNDAIGETVIKGGEIKGKTDSGLSAGNNAKIYGGTITGQTYGVLVTDVGQVALAGAPTITGNSGTIKVSRALPDSADAAPIVTFIGDTYYTGTNLEITLGTNAKTAGYLVQGNASSIGKFSLAANALDGTTLSAQTEEENLKLIDNSAPTAYNIWVGDIQVTSANSADVLGTTGGDDATVTYDPNTNILTLNGATVDSIHTKQGDLNIQLQGTNKVTGFSGISSAGGVVIDGTGSLNMQGNSIEPAPNASVTIKGGTINLSGAGGTGGIIAGSVSIEGGKVTIKNYNLGLVCNSVTISGGEVEIQCSGGLCAADIQATDGVTVSGGTVKISDNYYGILAVNGGVSITGGEVIASGNDYGISAHGDIVVEGGKVTASGEKAGLDSGNTVTISGGIVNAASSSSDPYYGAIYGHQGVNITGGTGTASGSSKAINQAPVLGSDVVVISGAWNETSMSWGTPAGPVEAYWGSDLGNLTRLGSLEEALAAAKAGNASYIQLQKDVVRSEQISIQNSLTMDLNGHSITDAESFSGGQLLSINGSSTCTITDASAAKNGKVEVKNNRFVNTILISGDSTLKLKGGDILNSQTTAVWVGSFPSSSGTFHMTGGSVSAVEDFIYAVHVDKGSASISGGKVSGNGGCVINLSNDQTLEVGGNAEIENTSTKLDSNGYARQIIRQRSGSSLYLYGSPTFTAARPDTVDIKHISTGCNTYAHKQGDESTPYTGDGLVINFNNDPPVGEIVVHGVTDANSGKFSAITWKGYAIPLEQKDGNLVVAASTPPSITTTALSDGKVGEPYNQTLTATGTAPITWSVITGSLPEGLVLNTQTGEISGTPTKAGTYTFTVQAQNAAGTAERQLTIVIAGKSGGGSTGGGSDSSDRDDDEYDFWMEVKDKISDADSSDVIKVNAKGYDKMPYSVMSELRKNSSVSLVIRWNGGEDIIIPAGQARPAESLRIYYPLSLLEELYKGKSLTDPVTGKPVDPSKLNPETGGVLEIDAPPAADIRTADEPVIVDAQRGTAETPELAERGVEKAIPGVYEPEEALAVPSANKIPLFILLAALIAATTIGTFYWKKRHE